MFLVPVCLCLQTEIRSALGFSDSFPQLKYGQAEGIRNHFHSIQCRICHAPFQATQVGLIKPAALTELDLRQSRVQPQLTHAATKFFSD